MKVVGTLERRDLEGGIWQLVTDDGQRYTLLGGKGLSSGERVEVEGSLDEGFGISMSGPQLRVSRVRKVT